MKKLTAILFACITLALATPGEVLAADMTKGEKTLGIGGGYASYNNSGYANVYFQYTFVPHVRLAPEVGYIFRNQDTTGFQMSCDVQFPFRIVRGFNIYPLVGLTMNAWNYIHDGSAVRVGADMGFGVEVYITSNLKFSFQAKYSVMKDTSGAFAGAGIGYVF